MPDYIALAFIVQRFGFHFIVKIETKMFKWEFNDKFILKY